MSTVLGNLGTQFFAYVQSRGLGVVRKSDLTRGLGITPVQETNLLSRLARKNLIARVRRGLYLVPPRIPPGGKWTPSEFLALSTLMADCGAQYQICGPNAFHRYAWDEQVPNRVYVYNDRISAQRTIGVVELTLIKVAKERLGATAAFRTPDGIEAIYSSRIRSLMDGVYDWSRFGSLPRAYDWIRAELARDSKAASQIVKTTAAYGNISTVRRVGKLLEIEGIQKSLLRKLERQILPSSASIPWDPTRPKRGTVERRWGVVFNERA